MYYETRDIVGGKEVILSDPFTFRDYEAFFEIISMIKENNHKRIVFDLSDCDFIDSAALGMFSIAYGEALKTETDLTIRGARDQVKELFDHTHFYRFYDFE